MPAHTMLAAIAAASLVQVAGQAPSLPGATRHCEQSSDTQLRLWQTRGPVREQPPTTDGARVRHWPTKTLGTWVVEVASAERAELTRVAPGEITRVVFDTRCEPSTRVEPRPRAEAPRFTDQDLIARAARGERGVIHVWSPHMPLSVDAIGPLTTAARTASLAVDLVLDPAADRGFAARVAAERDLPVSALRVADSVELLFRDALVHAPSVLVYAGESIAGSVYPGGHTAEEYIAHFARVLNERR